LTDDDRRRLERFLIRTASDVWTQLRATARQREAARQVASAAIEKAIRDAYATQEETK
jgi:hypothetical protein